MDVCAQSNETRARHRFRQVMGAVLGGCVREGTWVGPVLLLRPASFLCK